MEAESKRLRIKGICCIIGALCVEFVRFGIWNCSRLQVLRNRIFMGNNGAIYRILFAEVRFKCNERSAFDCVSSNGANWGNW